jgi:UDP-glucose 4-epimerase
MSDRQVVLVTGVAGYLGSRVAAQLIAVNEHSANLEGEDQGSQNPEYHVIGLDNTPPLEPIKGLDFIQADVRNPLLIEVLQSENVNTIVHLAFRDTYHPSEKAFDLNVIGTMKVLGAAAEAGVRKVILRSSTAVYGALPDNSAFLTEDHVLNGNKSRSSIRDMVEIEAFVNGFQRQAPEMVITVLRFANILGLTIDSPLTRLLKQNPPLTLLGFDPLMQLIHENDVVNALVFAVQNDVPGAFNIATQGILPLGKIIGLAGRIPIPVVHLCAYAGVDVMKIVGLKRQDKFPFEPDYIRYPWVADLTRMHEEMGFEPTYTAEETLREFAGYLRIKKYKPESPDLSYDEERLRDILDRRQRMRDQRKKTLSDEYEEATYG